MMQVARSVSRAACCISNFKFKKMEKQRIKGLIVLGQALVDLNLEIMYSLSRMED